MVRKFYYIAMSQEDMFKNHVLEEILRERKTFYSTKKQEVDFWILISPNYFNSTIFQEKFKETNYYNQIKSKLKKNSIEPLCSLISINKEFLEWIKLRLGSFEKLTLNKENTDNLIFRPFYQSNGICGELDNFLDNKFSPLNTNDSNVNKNILVNTFSNLLEYIND